MFLPLIPVSHRTVRSSVLALLLALSLPLAVRARGPEPPQRIPLEPLGFQTISYRYLLEGATMLTVDYVDNDHLLVTFGVAKLMPRLADCPTDDEDRIVKAVLLELPTGRELAHTEWRFHDLGQYLWSLGDGHFLLRKRDSLTVFSPMQNFSSGDTFAEQPFLHIDRRIQAILVSANHDLLSIESVKRLPPETHEGAAQTLGQTPGQTASQPAGQPPIRNTGLQRRDPNVARPDPTPTQIDFIRVLKAETQAKTSAADAQPQTRLATRLVGRRDGRIFTSTAVSIPLTTEGFLRTKTTTRDGVLLDFLTFTGKDIDLGDFATSCPPHPTFVSPSEFVAFGCRGNEESLDLAGFNLKGDFLWQINFTDEQAYPSFATAVPAGRFAFSRTVTSSHVFGNETPSMSQLQAQEVRVIQTYNGKQLLRVVTSPIQRAGQNFTLSPDGLSLAVIHDNPTVKGEETTHHTSIEVYKLPPLSGPDIAQIKLEAAMAPAPAPSDVHMRFSAEEIKLALAAKPETGQSSSRLAAASTSKVTAPADSRIVGDTIPKAEPANSSAMPAAGTIPSSVAAPACATLTEAGSGAAAAACPATPQPRAAPGDFEAAPGKPRKPPTLYEPSPPDAPSSPPR